MNEAKMSNLGKIGGIVLCGGMSRRMGQPKAWLPFHGETMLARVCRVLGEVVNPIVVVAGPDQEVPPLPNAIEIVRDMEQAQGPLQGLVGGLKALEGEADTAYMSSCDVPFLQPSFVRAVIAFLEGSDIAVPEVDGYLHPLAAAYRLSVRPVAEALLAAGQRRPLFLFEQTKTRRISADELRTVDPQFASLRNLNTPEEYEAALRM